MDTKQQDDLPPAPTDKPSPSPLDEAALSRRTFLRGAALAGGGVIAAGVAACAPATTANWTTGPSGIPSRPPVAPTASAAPSAAPTAGGSAAPSGSVAPSASAPAVAIPPGWTAHDVAARDKVRRYLGSLPKALPSIYPEAVAAKLGEILGVADAYPELDQKPAFVQVPNLVLTDAFTPLEPTVEGDIKVFRLTVDEHEHRIDELMPPVAALGFNSQWPGPTIRVNEGDRVRAIFTNNLKETTGIHFHGVEFTDVFQDGVPFLTQQPITPGEEYSYDFVASRPGSMMYHSHHNATDQVGRGLLGAFIVDPRTPTADDRFDREYVWISNDTLGGFTINGHGFPATVPVLAAQGETVRIRFMNEGIMMHPWHLHGFEMKVVARDGYPLGAAAYGCDTFGVNPGERWDVNIKADRLGVWAFHCHILPHAEGPDGMFGMVTTMIVVPEKSHVDAILAALKA